MGRSHWVLLAATATACGSETVEIGLPTVDGAQTLIVAQAEERQNPPTFDVRVIDLHQPVTPEMLPGLGETNARDLVRYTALYHSTPVESLRLEAGRAVIPAPEGIRTARVGDFVETATVYEARFVDDALSSWSRGVEIDANLAGVPIPRDSDCVELDALEGSVELRTRVAVGWVVDAGEGRLLVQTRVGGIFEDPTHLYLVERHRHTMPREVVDFPGAVRGAFRAAFRNREDDSLLFIGDDFQLLRATGVRSQGSDQAELVGIEPIAVPTSTRCDDPNREDLWRCQWPQCDSTPSEGRLPFWMDGNLSAQGDLEVFALHRSGAFERFDGSGPAKCIYRFGDEQQREAKVVWIGPGQALAVKEPNPEVVFYDQGQVRVEVPDPNTALSSVAWIPRFGIVVGSTEGAIFVRRGPDDYRRIDTGARVSLYDLTLLSNPFTGQSGILFAGFAFTVGQAWPLRDPEGCLEPKTLTRQTSYFVRPLGADAFLLIGNRLSADLDDFILGTVVVPRYGR